MSRCATHTDKRRRRRLALMILCSHRAGFNRWMSTEIEGLNCGQVFPIFRIEAACFGKVYHLAAFELTGADDPDVWIRLALDCHQLADRNISTAAQMVGRTSGKGNVGVNQLRDEP